MNVFELPVIDKIVASIGMAIDRILPDRNQRFSMSVEAATGNIRAELGGQGWLSGNWRAMVSLGVWGLLGFDHVMGRELDLLWLGIGLLCLSGYTLNRETIANITEFFKALREQKPKEK